jgi:polyphosphate kinase
MSVIHPRDAEVAAELRPAPAADAGVRREQRTPAPTSGPGRRYLNRHLSWLDFNARVLAQAEDVDLPLLERAKFLAIFSSNLDEFFQVRVGGLHEQQLTGLSVLSPDGMTVVEQLRAIRSRVLEILPRQMRCFNDVVERLDEVGVRFSDYPGLDEDDRGHLDHVFEEQIFPVLTPLAVDPAHPFPYISNLSLNLAVVVGDPDAVAPRIARVKVPPLLPRFIVMPDGERFVPIEQVIAAHLDRLFPGMRILGHYPFRVTRNADFAVDDDEADDLLAAAETIVRRRRRSPSVVRLEIDATMSEQVLDLLLRELEITPTEVYCVEGPLDLRGLMPLYSLDRPELRLEPWKPVTQPRLAGSPEGPPDIFRTLSEGDVLVQHPYDSFTTSVEAFVFSAARDPDVLAIKQTLYRTSGADSPIVRALIRAAEEGKQVVALIELTARFDEEVNIAWARVLEEAGVHVVYGLVGLKTHAKVSLVVRREGAQIRRYCHVGTGNYNQETARLYEDIGLLSADPDLGADLSDLFNYLTGYSRQRSYRRLLVAPDTMRRGLLRLIRGQAHPGGRIVVKVNHLVDPEIVDAFYAAATAGADIDLVVRSSCGIRPGVPGLSERIRVRSLVGRYLEHSRIFRFGPDGEAEWFIGSSDLMARNLDGRVETVTPVVDPALRVRLGEILDVVLADDVLAWELSADGAWRKVPTERGINAHRFLQDLAVARSTAAMA